MIYLRLLNIPIKNGSDGLSCGDFARQRVMADDTTSSTATLSGSIGGASDVIALRSSNAALP